LSWKLEGSECELLALSGERASRIVELGEVFWKDTPWKVTALSAQRPLFANDALFNESGSLGMLPKFAGILLRRLNIGPRPIANK